MKPIMFSAPMIEAVLNSTKTQTRRVVQPQPEIVRGGLEWKPPGGGAFWAGPSAQHRMLTGGLRNGDMQSAMPDCCPYVADLDSADRGKPDLLWVRETFFAFGRWETRFSEKKSRDEWHFVDMTLETGRSYRYVRDGIATATRRLAGATPEWWKRPAIFMPRAASRITLQVTEVRVERLQAISEADAIAEGCVAKPFPGPWWQGYRDIGDGELMHQQAVGEEPPDWMLEPKRMSDNKHLDRSAVDAYRALWIHINGVASWEASPYVWVVSFTRLP